MGSGILTLEFMILIAVGFLAQIVDGTLGMAFGVISTSVMLVIGLAPAQASAIVHTAEIFTTSASAASHLYHRNVDWRLVVRLGGAGVLGAVLGAWVLSNVDSTVVRPYLAAHLVVIGGFILFKAWRMPATRDAPTAWAAPIGLVAGFLDASGGGGWGPVARRRWWDQAMRRARQSGRSIPPNSSSPLPRPRHFSSSSARLRYAIWFHS